MILMSYEMDRRYCRIWRLVKAVWSIGKLESSNRMAAPCSDAPSWQCQDRIETWV